MATIYYTATSLDGFLATKENDLSWLDALPQPNTDTYGPFIANVGALCMGAATYEFLLAHVAKGNPWPYQQPTWVFTHRNLPTPAGADIRFVSGEVAPVHALMVVAAAGKDVWVCGGGELVGQFLDRGLLDELVITVAAQTIGAGKPLLPRMARLRLVSAKMLGAGFAELRFVPRRNS